MDQETASPGGEAPHHRRHGSHAAPARRSSARRSPRRSAGALPKATASIRRKTSAACRPACRCATKIAGAGSTPSRSRSAQAERQGETLVVACSALKRIYRDRLRLASRHLRFVYLEIGRDVAAARVAARKGHFMPASLIDSQFADLEPPTPDEGATEARRDQGSGVNSRPSRCRLSCARCRPFRRCGKILICANRIPR